MNTILKSLIPKNHNADTIYSPSKNGIYMELKAGYKNTEIGVIPEDWEVKKFTECAVLKHGFQFREEHFSTDGIKVVKIGTLKYSGELDFSNATFIDNNELEKFSNFLLGNGDILMALTGATLGKCSIVNTEEKLLQNYRVGNFFNTPICTKKYVYVLLQSDYIQKTFKKLVNEAAQPNIGKGDFDKFYIPLPPTKAEQTAIATALSDADALISSLEKLIAKKRNIKQGAMQKCLNYDSFDLYDEDDLSVDDEKKSQKSLNHKNQRSDKWEVKKLGEVGEIRMCKRIFSNQTKEHGDIPFFKIGTFGSEPDAYISNELYVEFKQRFSFPKKGDILISAAGTIGRTVIYNGQPSYFQDSNIVWIENHEGLVSNQYLFYILQIVNFNTEGGTIQRLYNSILRNAEFYCPSKAEQTRIATILSDMDAEITALETKLEKYRKVKLGMMQNLLTGKIRLI